MIDWQTMCFTWKRKFIDHLVLVIFMCYLCFFFSFSKLHNVAFLLATMDLASDPSARASFERAIVIWDSHKNDNVGPFCTILGHFGHFKQIWIGTTVQKDWQFWNPSQGMFLLATPLLWKSKANDHGQAHVHMNSKLYHMLAYVFLRIKKGKNQQSHACKS